MYQEQKLYIGKSGEEKVCIYPKMANRHGLIAGATGSGKTVSLRVLAESFSDCGVSVFLADAKGDLASMSLKGTGEGSLSGNLLGCIWRKGAAASHDHHRDGSTVA